jgi:DNA invertase Pin-like site-specific DNA recombinase
MFQVTGAFAEFERAMIRQRVRAGLKRAVEQGKPRAASKGACHGKTNPEPIAGRQGHVGGCSECGVGTGTVQRVAREMDAVRPFDGTGVAA